MTRRLPEFVSVLRPPRQFGALALAAALISCNWLVYVHAATTFAAAARRLPLSTLGLLQYIGPSLQFVIAVVIAHEPMPPSRWIGFAMIWAALLVVSVDALHAQHQRRRKAAANTPELEPLG